MSRGTTRPFRKHKERQHPSIYFFIVLALGVILLMWMFTVSIHQQPKKVGALDHFSRISAGTLRASDRRASRSPELPRASAARLGQRRCGSTPV